MADDRAARVLPSALPTTFTYAQARAAGLTRHALYQARDSGVIEAVARGVYRRHDAAPSDIDLAIVARRSPRATICLTTALVHHDLSDAIPAATDVALPRGVRIPAGMPSTVEWHLFAADTFDIGRQTMAVEAGLEIGLYSAERSIIDAFRIRGREGRELGHEALRRWLRRRGSQPGDLLNLSRQFPRATGPLQTALEVLL